MRTAYLFWARCDNSSYRSYGDQGLVYISAAIDLGFLDNVVFDSGGRKTKLQVWQPGENSPIPSVPKIWYTIFDDRPMANAHLEEAFRLASGLGYQLVPYTRLGQSFSLRQAYTIPNLWPECAIEDTQIGLSVNGGFEELIWVDYSKTITDGDGALVHAAEAKRVRADLAVVVESQSQQTQVQRVHTTVPPPNSTVDTSHLRTEGDTRRLHEIRTPGNDSAVELIFELYNEALCATNMLTSFLTMYQIIEVLIDLAPGTPLDSDIVEALAIAALDNGLAPNLADRVTSSVKNIRRETSKELLGEALALTTPSAESGDFELEDFSKWRQARGRLTHPRSSGRRSELELSELYGSLRRFADALIERLTEPGSRLQNESEETSDEDPESI